MNTYSTSNFNRPLVTIAIPAFKRKWLVEAIDSALSQDYSNIELIIVDDHSPQNLEEVVAPYLKDNRVHYYFNDVNLGSDSIVLNWNRCIDLAHGEFFILLCDDDLLMPNFVSTLLALAEKYPNCDVFHGRRQVKNDATGVIEQDEVWKEFLSYQDLFSNFRLMQHHTITEFMYRTAVIKEKKYKVYPLGWGSDDYSIINFAHNGGVASSSNCIAMFRWSNEHISCSEKNRYLKCLIRIQEYQDLGNLPDIPWTHKQITDFMDSSLAYHMKNLTVWETVKFLCHVPEEVWKWKQKVLLLIRRIQNGPVDCYN